MITKVFRSRTELRLKAEENNFELNAGGEGKPMKLLCHKRGDVRETRKTSNESSGGIVGRGGALVEAMTFNRRIVGSTSALAAT